MHYLLVFDRRDKRLVPMKEIGQKGSVKLCRVPAAGVASAERTEMYRTEAITSGSGYHRMYGEVTNLCWKPVFTYDFP